MLQKKASPTKDLLHPTAPQTLDLLVVDPIEPQDLDPAPHLLLAAIPFETISTLTVTSDEAIEHHLVESTASGHFHQELGAEIKQALSRLLAAVEDMLLENDLQFGPETTMLNRLISSQTWLA